MAGRPTIYSPELTNEICRRLALGNSLRKVCEADDMPDMSVIFDWFRLYPEFTNQYAQAKEASAEADNEILEELGDLAISEAKNVDPKSSNAVVSAYKLKADNMKWYMSKKKPKKYGEKLDLLNNGKDFPAPIYGGSNTIKGV